MFQSFHNKKLWNLWQIRFFSKSRKIIWRFI